MKEDHDDPHLGALLRLVGSRPVVSDEVRARVRSAVHVQWKSTIRARALKREILFGAAAAVFAFALYSGVLLLAVRGNSVDSPIGFVENQVGTILVSPAFGGETRRVARGEMVLENRCLESAGNGRLLLHLTQGASVRMDVDTRVCAVSPTEFQLERGTMYFDSEQTGTRLHLATPFGTIRNRGTQFEVSVEPSRMSIRVREGSIELEKEGHRNTADAGTQLAVTGEGEVSRSIVERFSSMYRWLSDVPPTYHLEGSSLDSFLVWLSRETGWEVRFANTAILQSAGSVILHGSISGVRPEEMPDVVLPVCGLAYRLENGVLTIEEFRREEP